MKPPSVLLVKMMGPNNLHLKFSYSTNLHHQMRRACVLKKTTSKKDYLKKDYLKKRLPQASNVSCEAIWQLFADSRHVDHFLLIKFFFNFQPTLSLVPYFRVKFNIFWNFNPFIMFGYKKSFSI